MTTGDEGDEHQMERRLQWDANAYKGQCNEQRGPKATLPELASMKKNSRLSSDRSGVPYTGVKILPKLWEKVWMRRGDDDDPRRPKNGVLRKLKHIFPNTYQRIKSICSPAKGGTGCYRFNYQPGS